MRFKVIAKVLIVNQYGQIVSIQRSKHDTSRAGDWDFPGGNLDENEGHLHAVIRETAEETGLAIDNPQLLYATTKVREDEGEMRILTFLFFTARIHGTPHITLDPSEHDASGWYTPQELRSKLKIEVFIEALDFLSKNNLLTPSTP